LKNFLLLTIPILFLVSCNSSFEDKKDKDDSLQYYPPTPVKIKKKEFRKYYRELSLFFDTTLINKGFNGGILIAKDGQVIYEKYIGKTDLRKSDTLTDSTSLHIASISKTFTATAILKLYEEKKLNLDDSLNKYFPDFPYKGITIKMLLNHRSGLPNYLYFITKKIWNTISAKHPGKKYINNEDVLEILSTVKPEISYPPDNRFSYSNTNYVLLAMIIEKISGMTYPEYMQHYIFDPLKMNHTFVYTSKDSSRAPASFYNKGTVWEPDFFDGTYGDKNIYSTPQDLLKWDQALYNPQFISPSLLDAAFSGYSFEKPTMHNYGLGWRLIFLPNGKKVVYHFGKWHGFNAAFSRLTDEKVTIIITGNKSNRTIYTAAHLCYDIFGDYQQHLLKEEPETDSLNTDKKSSVSEIKSKTELSP